MKCTETSLTQLALFSSAALSMADMTTLSPSATFSWEMGPDRPVFDAFVVELDQLWLENVEEARRDLDTAAIFRQLQTHSVVIDIHTDATLVLPHNKESV